MKEKDQSDKLTSLNLKSSINKEQKDYATFANRHLKPMLLDQRYSVNKKTRFRCNVTIISC